MSRALGRGGLAHPAGILVVFVITAAWGRPRRTRLKQMTACAYFRTQLFPSDASSFQNYRYFVSLQETLNSFLICAFDPDMQLLFNIQSEEYARSINVFLLYLKYTRGKIKTILRWHRYKITEVFLLQWIIHNEVNK